MWLWIWLKLSPTGRSLGLTPPLFTMATQNTSFAQVLGVTPLEIYAMKLISHGSTAFEALKDELVGSLVNKGYVIVGSFGGVPRLTSQGLTLMASLNY